MSASTTSAASTESVDFMVISTTRKVLRLRYFTRVNA